MIIAGIMQIYAKDIYIDRHFPLEPGISCLRAQKLDLIINVPYRFLLSLFSPFPSWVQIPSGTRICLRVDVISIFNILCNAHF